MSFGNYIKDKMSYIIVIFFVMISCEILLIPFQINMLIKIYLVFTPMLVFMICFLIEYYKKRTYYNNVKMKLDELEEKYLITALLGRANFTEAKILEEMLQEINKSMIENVNKYKFRQEEYKEYIELWIHEIKIPISAGKMIIENNKNEVTRKY